MEEYVFEPVALNDVSEQDAFQRYPEAKQLFESRLGAYKQEVGKLKTRPPLSIRPAEMKRIDALAAEVGTLQKTCQEFTATLQRASSRLLIEATSLQGELAGLAPGPGLDNSTLTKGLEMLDQGRRCKMDGDLILGLHYAFRAREFFKSTMATAAAEWLCGHEESLGDFGHNGVAPEFEIIEEEV